MPLDPSDVAIIVDALCERLGPLHSDVAQKLQELTSEVAQLNNRTDIVERQMRAVERKANLTMMALNDFPDVAASQEPALPTPAMERPIEIDRACAAAGTTDARPAVIPELGNLVIYPKSGFGPAEVWGDVVQSIEAARSASTRGGASETTGLRRTRRAKKH